ncbi:ATP-binding protein [Streptomyces sp. NPDC002055]|uniref:ATP-binding protein n=1 Tax=Streptomyces sp. NPDC002055 TaxID=3154534 RepID=UPI00332EB3F2
MTMHQGPDAVVRCSPASDPSPQAVFPSEPGTVGQARSYAREVMERDLPGADPEFVREVQLVVSELVTNAVRYGTEPGDFVALAVVVGTGRVRIEVHDPVRKHPRLRPESDERQRGRGLLIVDRLAKWGVDERPFGKVVWADMSW